MDLKNRLLVFYPLLLQVIRFGIVGLCVSLLHFGLVVSLVELHLMKPLSANMLVFLFTFQVSYWGHRCWTFTGTTVYHHVAIKRLLLVAVSNFIANQGLFYIFLTLFKLPYILALFIVLAILPALTFTLGKWWVFR